MIDKFELFEEKMILETYSVIQDMKKYEKKWAKEDKIFRVFSFLETPLFIFGMICFFTEPIVQSIRVFPVVAWLIMRLFEGFTFGLGMACFMIRQRENRNRKLDSKWIKFRASIAEKEITKRAEEILAKQEQEVNEQKN